MMWVQQQFRKYPSKMNDEEFQEIVAQEVAGVGVGDFYDNMQELHVIAYNKDMKSPDQDK